MVRAVVAEPTGPLDLKFEIDWPHHTGCPAGPPLFLSVLIRVHPWLKNLQPHRFGLNSLAYNQTPGH
jgi:hypothetical protein